MRRGDFELVTLRNGARAVRHLGHGEVMHPSVGPWVEANRLYVEQPKLAQRLRAAERPLVVWDVGLGAATNAAAAIACARETGAAALDLHSFELELAPLELARACPEGFPYLVSLGAELTALTSGGRAQGERLTWTLHLGDAPALYARAPAPQFILYDPFSSRSNPALWTAEAFRAVRAACAPEALLMTYSGSTRVRAAMLQGGFFVGEGWSVGTRTQTTVAATRLDLLEAPLGDRWLSRMSRSSAVEAGLHAALRAHPQFASGAP